jgi:hypothetical protein
MLEVCTAGSMRGMWERGYGKVTWAPSNERDGSDKPNQTYCYHATSLPYQFSVCDG